MRVAVVGGGPGGLMSARLLECKLGSNGHVTLFEASGRLGGKIQTRVFDTAPAMYEAGVAECYDLEGFGRDPLKELVRDLGLRPVPTHSSAVALDGVVLNDDAAVASQCGERTLAAIEGFRRQATAMMPATSWYRGFTPADNQHPWHRSCEDLLDDIPDPVARRYLRTLIHSDMATEPHLTTALIGLRNVVKNVQGYGAQYTIDGGMERLPRQLAARLNATEIRLNAPVVRISSAPGRGFALDIGQGRHRHRETFDAVVAALPHNHLRQVEWAGEPLRRALVRHVAHYDHPAHYLRISILFDRPFWREVFSGSWLMLDAFGGCCLYDERGASTAPGFGVLGWLLAGADALSHCDADDDTLIARAIDSLPDAICREARDRVVEARVHRWAGALSGTPGGVPLRDPRIAHQPEPFEHGRLVVVGDYLFDSTLNGVLRSAGIATDLLIGECIDCDSERDGVSSDRHRRKHVGVAPSTAFTPAESPAAAR